MFLPELFLPRLNHALVTLITACDAVIDGPINDKGETAEEALRPIMRRLLLGQTLGKYSLLAIAGTQGAGKTTLVKSLYELTGEDAGWLETNEGRGETYPILITENSEATSAEGFVWTLEQDEDRKEIVRRSLLEGERSLKEAQECFRRATCEQEGSELLAELCLPGRLGLGNRKGWLLLPGYEARTAGNEVWQETMRAALAGATGSIVVTDQTRLARDQADLARETMKNVLNGIEPLVVITKTEKIQKDQEKLRELQERAVVAFGVEPERIQCVGGTEDQKYAAVWREDLKRKINAFVTQAGGGSDAVRHKALSLLIGSDLKRTLSDISRSVRLACAVSEGVEEQAERLNAFLDMFERSAQKLRTKYKKVIENTLKSHAAQSETYFKEKLVKDFEGITKNFTSFFSSDTKQLLKLEKAVSEADTHGGNLAMEIAEALEGPVRAILTRSSSHDDSDAEKYLQITGPEGETHYTAVPWTRGGEINNPDSPAYALVKLFSPDDAQFLQGKLTGIEDAIKMLPALTLEWARIASKVPASYVNGPEASISVFNPVEYASKQISPSVSTAKTLMKTAAQVMLVTDVASVGVGASGVAATGLLASPVAIAGTALLAVGYLGTSMLQEIRGHDRANRATGLAMLKNAQSVRLQEYVDVFDNLMDTARENLIEMLKRRYKVSDGLAKKDRVMHAIAVAKEMREELIEGLDSVPRMFELN